MMPGMEPIVGAGVGVGAVCIVVGLGMLVSKDLLGVGLLLLFTGALVICPAMIQNGRDAEAHTVAFQARYQKASKGMNKVIFTGALSKISALSKLHRRSSLFDGVK